VLSFTPMRSPTMPNGNTLLIPSSTANLVPPQPARSISPIPIAVAMQEAQQFLAAPNGQSSSSITTNSVRNLSPAGTNPNSPPSPTHGNGPIRIPVPQSALSSAQIPHRPVSVPTNTTPLPPTDLTDRPATAQPLAAISWVNPPVPQGSLQTAFSSLQPQAQTFFGAASQSTLSNQPSFQYQVSAPTAFSLKPPPLSHVQSNQSHLTLPSKPALGSTSAPEEEMD